METNYIVLIVLVALLVLVLIFGKRPSFEQTSYRGKAKLIARFTDEEGCFLCQFEKDGKIINAIYGNDSPKLKVGDEVDIVWDGWCQRLPLVMDKEVYNIDQRLKDNEDNPF